MRWEVDRDVAEATPFMDESLVIQERVKLPVEASSRIALDRDTQDAVPRPPHHASDRQRLVRRNLVSERDDVVDKEVGVGRLLMRRDSVGHGRIATR